MTVTVDKYTRVLLTVIAVLLTVVAAGMWYEAPSTTATAQAKIPDSGLQLQKLTDQTQAIATSLGNLSELLVSGNVKVRIVESDAAKKSEVAISQEGTPGTAK